MYDFDVLVLGSGPGGQKAAIAAAKLGKKAAVVERRDMIGGVCINTGTIPSKTFREAIMHLSGYNERGLYGASYAVKDDISMGDLLHRTTSVIGHELDVVRSQLHRNRIEVISAEASFMGPHTVRLRDTTCKLTRVVRCPLQPQGSAHTVSEASLTRRGVCDSRDLEGETEREALEDTPELANQWLVQAPRSRQRYRWV